MGCIYIFGNWVVFIFLAIGLYFLFLAIGLYFLFWQLGCNYIFGNWVVFSICGNWVVFSIFVMNSIFSSVVEPGRPLLSPTSEGNNITAPKTSYYFDKVDLVLLFKSYGIE